MGCFTWTLANRKIKKTGWGYDSSCNFGYGHTGYIALPKGITYEGCIFNKRGYAFIEEKFYDGYGMFGYHDVFDVIADINKECAVEFFSNPNAVWREKLLPIAKFWTSDKCKSDEDVTEYAQKIGFMCPEEWKRHIGIAMTSYDEDQARIKYPLKIVSSINCKKNYEDLPFSHTTQ